MGTGGTRGGKIGRIDFVETTPQGSCSHDQPPGDVPLMADPMPTLSYTEPTVSTQEKVFGVTLGLGAGLVVLSLMFTTHTLEMAFAVGGSFGLLLIAPLALGAWIGKRLADKGYFRRIRWQGIALVLLLGWPAAIIVPPVFRVLHAHQLEHGLPIYPNSQVTNRSFEPFDSDNGPASVSVELRTSAARNDILGFYRTELVRQHWKETPVPQSWTYHRPDLYFRRWTLTTEVRVENDANGQLSTVKVICEF